MIRVIYTATRELIGLHESGDTVTLSFSTSQLAPGRVVSRSQQKAIGGQSETLWHNALRSWTLTTEPLTGASLDAMIEFLSSVEGGEAFTFEAWRRETGPSLELDFLTPRFRVVEPARVKLKSEGWQLEEVIRNGNGGDDDVFMISFAVEEDPA